MRFLSFNGLCIGYTYPTRSKGTCSKCRSEVDPTILCVWFNSYKKPSLQHVACLKGTSKESWISQAGSPVTASGRECFYCKKTGFTVDIGVSAIHLSCLDKLIEIAIAANIAPVKCTRVFMSDPSLFSQEEHFYYSTRSKNIDRRDIFYKDLLSIINNYPAVKLEDPPTFGKSELRVGSTVWFRENTLYPSEVHTLEELLTYVLSSSIEKRVLFLVGSKASQIQNLVQGIVATSLTSWSLERKLLEFRKVKVPQSLKVIQRMILGDASREEIASCVLHNFPLIRNIAKQALE